MKNNHGFSNILIIILVLGVVLAGGYFGYGYFNKAKVDTQYENISNNESITDQKNPNPQEFEFKGINNCPKNECKNLEVLTSYNQIQFLDKEVNKSYTSNVGQMDPGHQIKFDKNYIYFVTYTFNQSTMEVVEEKINSLNINNGDIKELMSIKSKINAFLVSNNIIFYSTGKTCGEACLDPKNTYDHKLYSYNIDSKETIKLNSKNLTDSGYVVKAPYGDKFIFESGRINIYKLENSRLVMSFGQMIQPAEWFFYFDLDTKQVSNIDGTKLYAGKELIEKKKSFGALSGSESKLFIRNGTFEIALQ